MKILTVTEFDPSGVHLRHRRHLRALGVDYRVYAESIYREEGLEVDWAGFHTRGLREFADEADVIQFCPAIGQPWSYLHTSFETHDADAIRWGDVSWSSDAFSAVKVAVFHGSLNASVQKQQYAEYYRARGMTIAATTLDYAHEMGALYLPAIIDALPEPAALREEGEPLRVIHSPTDERMCDTPAFVDMCKSIAHVDLTFVSGVPHDELLQLKRRHHAGYDHLRGSFSINSLENASLGLVNLVGLRPQYAAHLASQPPFLPVMDMGDVERWLRALAASVPFTRAHQTAARHWATTYWSPLAIAHQLLNTYRTLVHGA